MTAAAWSAGYSTAPGTVQTDIFSTAAANWITVSGGVTTCTNSTAYLKNNSSALLIEPDGQALCKFRLRNLSIVPGSVGKMGLWIYLPVTPSAGSIGLIFSPLPTSEGADTVYATWSAARLKQGWNFLTWAPTGTNYTTHPTGTTTIGNGAYATVAAILEFLRAGKIQCITLNFSSWPAGQPVYFDSIVWGQRSRANVVLGFDGKSTSNLTTTLPYMTDRGFAGYVACHCDTDGSTSLSPTAISQMDQYYDAGWDIINHTLNHKNYTTEITDASAITADVLAMQAVIDSNGWTRGKGHFVYTQGAYNETTIAAVYAAGMKLQRCGVSGVFPTVADGWNGLDSIYGLCGGKEIENTVTQAQARAQIDAAILYGETVWPFWHATTTSGDATNNSGVSTTVNTLFLQSFLDYVLMKQQQGLIDVLTPSQWYRGLTQPALVS